MATYVSVGGQSFAPPAFVGIVFNVLLLLMIGFLLWKLLSQFMIARVLFVGFGAATVTQLFLELNAQLLAAFGWVRAGEVMMTIANASAWWMLVLAMYLRLDFELKRKKRQREAIATILDDHGLAIKESV